MTGFSPRLYNLYMNHPNWRLYVILRAATILSAFLSVICLGVVVDWNRKNYPTYHGWTYASWDVEWSFFAPGIFSLTWATTTLSKLLITTKPFSAVWDILIDLTISMIAVFAIIYAASVSGPMQWFMDGANSESSVVYAGSWEVTGVVALTLLFLLHAFLFAWAWRVIFSQPREETRQIEFLRGPLNMRRATPDEEAIWFPHVKEPEDDPWFDKYISQQCYRATEERR